MLPRDAEGYVTTGAKWGMVGVAAFLSGGCIAGSILHLSGESDDQRSQERAGCEAPYAYKEGICVLNPYAIETTEAPYAYDDSAPDETTEAPTEEPTEEAEPQAGPTPEETEEAQDPENHISSQVELDDDTCRAWGDISHQPFVYDEKGQPFITIDTRWRDGCSPDLHDGATVYRRANTGSTKIGKLANGSVVRIVGLECAQIPKPMPKEPTTGNNMPSALWLTVKVNGKTGKVTGYDTGYPDQQTLRSSGFTQKYAKPGQGGNC
jgi:hypothetical protein